MTDVILRKLVMQAAKRVQRQARQQAMKPEQMRRMAALLNGIDIFTADMLPKRRHRRGNA